MSAVLNEGPIEGLSAFDIVNRELARMYGHAHEGMIPAAMTFRQWCEDLAGRGMKVDGKPFRLDDRAALAPIYDAIPATREQAKDQILVIQKAAQIGITIWEVLAAVYMSLKFSPVNIGLFLPDQATASFKSEHRFMRVARSAPELYRHLVEREVPAGASRKIGEGNVLTRVIGESILMFLWTSGKVTTESRPMDIVTLDEVQEMTLEEIDKVRMRLGDSDLALTLMLSTANIPDADINFWFKLGTQEVWHTECPKCHVLSDLTDPVTAFPAKSVAYNTGQFKKAPMNEYVWTCPACGAWIEDPQRGRCIQTNPNPQRGVRSFLLPRTVSPRETPRRMMEAWNRARSGGQKKSFFNRVLGRPFLDPSQIPVTMTHCIEAAEEGARAGVTWKQAARDTYMGIDQMGGFNAVIIKERLPDGRQAVIHVEAVFSDDPFARCDELMRQYGVAVCVVEQLPNANDARRFCNRHKGRAFMAGYADLKNDMMVWGDDLARSDRKTADEDRSRYSVTLNQYKCMQAALFRVRDRLCLFPNPDGLLQDVPEDGVPKRIAILRDWVWLHLTKTALVVEDDPETRKTKAKVVKVGIDPHYAFANMLCDVAWARAWGTTSFILPGLEKITETPKDKQEQVKRTMPGLPSHVLSMVQELPPGERCGRCTEFDADKGLCTLRALHVKPADPGCPIFTPKGD